MQLNLSLFFFFTLSFSSGLSAQTTANFFFDIVDHPGKMVAPANIEFMNASQGYSLDYNWTLNGESFSIEEDTQLAIKKSGTYDICLELKGEEGEDKMCQRLEFFDRDTRQEVISASK